MANIDCGSLAAPKRPAKAGNPPAAAPVLAHAPVPAPPQSPIIEPGREGVGDDGLTPTQRRAITLLAGGRSIKSAALTLGVHRATVHRWLSEDHAFRAVYHTWKAEVQESAQAQLLSLSNAAVKTFRQAIRMGDLRAAAMLLKGLSILSPSASGPRDPEESRRRAEIEETERESALIESETAARWRYGSARDARPWSVRVAEEEAEAAAKARQPGQADSPKKAE